MKKQPKRFLCWDEKIIEKSNNIQILAHRPVKKNLALVCDSEWEGPHNGYASIVKVGDTYRMYYRADSMRQHMDKSKVPGKPVICVAESRDGGITFKKPRIGRYEYNGSKYNNIVFMRDQPIDNFSVFYDTNPACPKEEKFKALCEKMDLETYATQLIYYASEDGYEFHEMYSLEALRGTFDTFNVTFWDEHSKQYFIYYRAWHTKEGEDRLQWRGIKGHDIRDIRVATSNDFRTWTVHGRICFEAGQEDYPLYTNQITKYFRSPDTMIGFPVRYADRKDEAGNFDFMPLGDRHTSITEVYGREGTAVTDCVLMTSDDGFTFNRRDEAFMTPGPENHDNWWYGNCYTVYGLVETEAEEEGAPNEISFYMGENYRIKNVNFRRYTLRLDGFYSWFAPYRGGEVLTKPMTITGDELHVNFATSAVGGMAVTVCDENGQEMEGYSSYVLFGDSVDRPVEFSKPLQELKGQQVRLKFYLKDAHLYSFIFE